MKKIAVFSLLLLVSVFVTSSNKVEASECSTGYYGGGEDCFKNKSFRVTKEVRVEGDNEWKDKVVDVEPDETVEFRIKVKNVGEVGVDDMKYEDFLPDELERVGGSGLTEYWDNFDPGDEVKFTIEAKIDEDEFDNDKDFEKCVVNKVELYYDDAFEGSDTATVCYGDAEITELPETGPTSTVVLALSGFGFLAAGTLVKKRKLS